MGVAQGLAADVGGKEDLARFLEGEGLAVSGGRHQLDARRAGQRARRTHQIHLKEAAPSLSGVPADSAVQCRQALLDGQGAAQSWAVNAATFAPLSL